MKRLRLLYVLLSLAVADLGWLVMRFGDITPPKWLISPLTLLPGLLLLLGGILVGFSNLLSLIWLIIAYKPQVPEVTSEKIKSTFTVLLLFIAFNGTSHYLLQPRPLASQIAFNDPVSAVQDSMTVLRQLCESIDKDEFLSCQVGTNNILVFSTPVASESSSFNLGRMDTITSANAGFHFMKKEDARRLLSVLRFLNRNQIAGVVHEAFTWRYLYGKSYPIQNQWFSRDEEREPYLYIYDLPQDTLRFRNHVHIKDRIGRMVLVNVDDDT